MERQINYTIIGAVFFIIITCMVIFILWIGHIGVNEDKYRTYHITTDEEIVGIGVNTSVKYKGINIGSVKTIGFEKDHLGMVKIVLLIDSSIPIRKDSVVIIDSQGLAGLPFLSLKQSDNFEFIKKDDEAVLGFSQNLMNKITSNVDEVAEEFLGVLKNLRDLTNPENIQNITSIIKSLDTLTKTLVQTKDNLDILSKNSNSLLLNINRKFEMGEYDLKKVLDPVVLELEMNLQNINKFFQKGSILLDKFDSNPYDTLFGAQK